MSMTFRSSNEPVVTVSETGLVRGMAPGIAHVTAGVLTFDGRPVTGRVRSTYLRIEVLP
jgi:hypothetical protein